MKEMTQAEVADLKIGQRVAYFRDGGGDIGFGGYGLVTKRDAKGGVEIKLENDEGPEQVRKPIKFDKHGRERTSATCYRKYLLTVAEFERLGVYFLNRAEIIREMGELKKLIELRRYRDDFNRTTYRFSFDEYAAVVKLRSLLAAGATENE